MLLLRTSLSLGKRLPSSSWSPTWSAALAGLVLSGIRVTFVSTLDLRPSGILSLFDRELSPLPSLSSPLLAVVVHAASAWVGIDDDTSGSAILQTGIDSKVTDGEVSYDGE